MIWHLFTDPLLRGPAWGSLSLGVSSGILGAIMFVRRQNLIAETLSHTAYPGITLALTLATWMGQTPLKVSEVGLAAIGAFAMSWLGLVWLAALQRARVRRDAALCWVLSGSMGVGALLASHLQWVHPRLYQQAQGALYGQSATITDGQALWLGGFAAFCCAFAALLCKELLAANFDPQFAEVHGLSKVAIEACTSLLIAGCVVAGIRGGGLVLTTGLMVAPAIAARALTQRFGVLLALSAALGAASALGGLVLSLWLGAGFKAGVPAGPVMVLVAASAALLLLLFSPRGGFCYRLWRRRGFRARCAEENLLKALLRNGGVLTRDEGASWLGMTARRLRRHIRELCRLGLIECRREHCALTTAGTERAHYITRLHRLWELYLVHRMGVIAERVHANAEHIEHVLTPEIERQLTRLLSDPRKDPHERAIPPLPP